MTAVRPGDVSVLPSPTTKITKPCVHSDSPVHNAPPCKNLSVSIVNSDINSKLIESVDVQTSRAVVGRCSVGIGTENTDYSRVSTTPVLAPNGVENTVYESVQVQTDTPDIIELNLSLIHISEPTRPY